MSRKLLAGLAASLVFLPLAQGAQPGGASYRVYVTNERSGTLSVIEEPGARVTQTLALGKRPRGLKLSPDGKLLYVALSGSPPAGPNVDPATLPPADRDADGIGVVDLAQMKLLRILRGVSDPEQLAVSADGKRLYIASEDTGQAIVFDAADGRQLAALKVGDEPEGVTLSPDGRHVYMTSESDHQVTVIDTATQQAPALRRVLARRRARLRQQRDRRHHLGDRHGEVRGRADVEAGGRSAGAARGPCGFR
jgi:YVTN family beta-propeller protein